MRLPKPGFKTYVKTTLRHPLKRHRSIVYVSEAGEQYRDVGSIHTVLFQVMVILTFAVTCINVDYTIWGLALVFVVEVLHDLFRYFWTEFEQIDEEGRTIGPKKGGYTGLQKAMMALEALLVLAIATGAFVGTLDSPIDDIKAEGDWDAGEYAGMVIKTPGEAYVIAKAYMDERIPNAKLIGYEAVEETETEDYFFYFENPQKGLFIYNKVEMIKVWVYTTEQVSGQYYTAIPQEWEKANEIEPPI